MEIEDLEMQSYHSPKERHAIVNREQTGKSASRNGSTSPTLIIQRNGKIQSPAESANEATFYTNRPDRNAQAQDLSMGGRDFTNQRD